MERGEMNPTWFCHLAGRVSVGRWCPARGTRSVGVGLCTAGSLCRRLQASHVPQPPMSKVLVPG